MYKTKIKQVGTNRYQVLIERRNEYRAKYWSCCLEGSLEQCQQHVKDKGYVLVTEPLTPTSPNWESSIENFLIRNSWGMAIN